MFKLVVLLLVIATAVSEETKTQTSFTSSSTGDDGQSVSTSSVTGPDGKVREQTVKVDKDGKKTVTTDTKEGEKAAADVKDKLADIIPKVPVPGVDSTSKPRLP